MTVPGEITASLRAMVEGFLERVLYLAVALIRIGDQIVLVDFIVDALRALRPRDGAAAARPGTERPTGPMGITLRAHWDRLRSSFWFLPALMVSGAVLLAYATVALDETMVLRGVEAPSWVYSGGAQGASTVLGAIAGSMVTIAGVVFSLTLVALSIASSQLGPRLLQSFMRDASNQVVLGTFIATFLYCLLVLRTIRREAGAEFVPHLSVSVGVLLAVVSLAVLIYFIHHVSVSIQADEVIARVSADVFAGIDRLFPAQIGHGGSREAGPDEGAELPEAFAERARPVQYASDFAEKEPVMLRSISQLAGFGASRLRRQRVRRVGTAGTARP